MSAVVVFGAGGRTGRLIVDRALAEGYHVTAALRRPDTLSDLDRRWAASRRLNLATVDVRDAQAVRTVLPGHEAAVSAIASRGRHPHGLFSEGTRTMIDALNGSEVRRFVAVSSRGVNFRDPFLPLLYRRVVRPLLLRDVYADMQAMEALVRATRLDWTLVRPPRLIDAPARGTYRVEDGHNPRGGWTLARADLAAFVVEQIDSREWIHRAPTLAY
ncbi:NAD(P)-dependent oxidoreductase [Dactylosporangium matsuzakiense]|uniref:NADH-flavin reductase n=1 Tax=Dactylosporangium matsuzakiense TaxID=53360 RepID=A0A9W6KNZ0_9ACTN|nr:NAD(P)H-binding protein [Dactylosporangium matsuzakiense]GLL04582.1 NADH-flavin reductase [Dactylosporangium matsuzakiense]